MKKKNIIKRAMEKGKDAYDAVMDGFKRGGFRGAYQAALVVLGLTVGSVAHAADFTALETEITSAATSVAAVATAAIIAGFGIFVLIWGARKIKGALSSGG